MWPFSKRPTVEKLRGLKTIRVRGMRFRIKRINPFLDFPPEKIPQIFTDFPRHNDVHPVSEKDIRELMYSIIEAGVDDPPIGKKGGLLAEDLFRDPLMGTRLYYKILQHSLNRFRGLQNLFFWTRIKYSQLTLYANDMINGLQVTSSRKANLV